MRKRGQNARGKQVYDCKDDECERKNFIESYTYKSCEPETCKKAIKMIVDGNGTRATGRILGISKDSVTSILKKTRNGFHTPTITML